MATRAIPRQGASCVQFAPEPPDSAVMAASCPGRASRGDASVITISLIFGRVESDHHNKTQLSDHHNERTPLPLGMMPCRRIA